MVTVVNVCAWCDHEMSKNDEPVRKYEPGCTPKTVSHGCCNQCRPGVDAEIKAYLKGIENEKEKKMQSLSG